MIATIDGVLVQGTPEEINELINKRKPLKAIGVNTGTDGDWYNRLPKTWCQNTTCGTNITFTTS